MASPALDKIIFDWFTNEYENNNHEVSRARLQRKAKEVYESLVSQKVANPGMKITTGWVEKFCSRHNVVQRRITTQCQKAPKDYGDKVIKFVLYLKELRKKHNFEFGDIIGCDETGVWLDAASSTTLAPKGVKDVPVKTTGHNKMRLMILFSAKADRTKLKPFVLMNRKRPIKGCKKNFREGSF